MTLWIEFYRQYWQAYFSAMEVVADEIDYYWSK